MTEDASTLNVKDYLEEHGEIPNIYRFLDVGSPVCRFLVDSAFQDDVAGVATPFTVIAAHITLERLRENLAPLYDRNQTRLQDNLIGLSEAESQIHEGNRDRPQSAFSSTLDSVLQKQHDFFALCAAEKVAIHPRGAGGFSGGILALNTDRTKGLTTEVLFYTLCSAASIPIQITSLDQDLQGQDFAMTIAGQIYPVDVTATASKEGITKKLATTRTTIPIFMPFGSGGNMREPIFLDAIQGFGQQLLIRNDSLLSLDTISRGDIEGIKIPSLPDMNDTWGQSASFFDVLREYNADVLRSFKSRTDVNSELIGRTIEFWKLLDGG